MEEEAQHINQEKQQRIEEIMNHGETMTDMMKVDRKKYW